MKTKNYLTHSILLFMSISLLSITSCKKENSNPDTVEKVAPTLGNFPNITKTVGDPTFILTPPTSNSSGSFSFTSSNTTVATINDKVVTIKAAGTTTITATQTETSTYLTGSKSMTLTVNPVIPVAPTITNFPSITKTSTDSPFLLTAPTSNSSGSFTYTSSNESVATISGSTVTITGIGTSTIRATQTATTNYLSGYIEATLTVNQAISKPVVITTTIPGAGITSTSMIVGGNVTSDGNATVTERGIYWGTSSNPTTKLQIGDGLGEYSTTLTGLTPNTTYYVKAYAINSAGEEVGVEKYEVTSLNIGDNYLGGIVAYILKTGDPGYSSTIKHGLIAATTDQGTAAWSTGEQNVPGAEGTAIGTGNSNTNSIISVCASESGIAAKLCRVLGTEWYLPSVDELKKLYNLKLIDKGDIKEDMPYWSSTQLGGGDTSHAWNARFGGIWHGEEDGSRIGKSYVNYVRAMKSF